MKCTFIKGLQPQIRYELNLLKPRGLTKIIETALGIEETNREVRNYKFSRQSGTGRISEGRGSYVRKEAVRAGDRSEKNIRENGFKRLSATEWQEKREKELCFKCDEKFRPGHRCRNKQLQVLLVLDKELEAESEEEEEECTELAVSSVLGLTMPNTMKLRGQIGGSEVVCLVDSGASHNFISVGLVEQLGVSLQETRGYGVVMGNGLTVKGRGICRGIQLEVQQCIITEEYLPMTLSGCDVILRVKWLQSLGEVVSNWTQLTMKFKRNGEWVMLRGDLSLTRGLVGLKTLIKQTGEEDNLFLVHVYALEESGGMGTGGGNT